MSGGGDYYCQEGDYIERGKEAGSGLTWYGAPIPGPRRDLPNVTYLDAKFSFGKMLQKSRTYGNAARDDILERVMPAIPEAPFRTTRGEQRYIDVLQILGKRLVARESKVGYTRLTGRTRQEADLDSVMLRAGSKKGGFDEAVWEFWTSPVTGKIGPSPRLQAFLQKRGIKIVIH